jgi:hypothetical protein
MSLTVGLLVLACVVGLPVLAIVVLWRQRTAKGRAADEFYWVVQKAIQAAGFEPMGEGWYRGPGGIDARGLRMSISPNPLFRRGFTLRIAALSTTLHEVELRRGRPVPPECAAFAPLLERWESCGKVNLECYMATVTDQAPAPEDVKALAALAALPIAKAERGGTITYREGFEPKPPQWHWRHDLRAKLPKDVRRVCVSCWRDGPLLNDVLARILWELAGDARKFVMCPTEDLRFLEMSFGRRGLGCWGALVELNDWDRLVAADAWTDGEFFGGLLVSRDVPPGFDVEGMPKRLFHEAAVGALRKVFWYARRLYDEENSWFSGEIEIVSAYALDVRPVVEKVANDVGATIMDIDRRFHKRLVKPLEW